MTEEETIQNPQEDSGTESAGAAVNEAETPEAATPETPSESEATQVEETDAAQAPAEDATVAEKTAAEEAPAAEAAPAAEPEAPAEPAPQSQPKKKRKRLPRALRHKHTQPTRERPGKRKPISRTQRQEAEPGRRQERRGVVVSDKGDKTIVVSVDVTKRHPRYMKVVRRSRKFHAHDEQNSAAIGDVVRIVETRPLSKTKNWRLAEIVEKAR